MPRLERPATASQNPATMFLEWKSERKCFEFYNKETKKKEDVHLPLKVLFLEHYHVIKGWHDPSKIGIISNEVFLLSKEKMKVRTFKGLEIAEGIHSEIKDKIRLAGGVYHRSIYVMLENGNLVNLQLKGSAVGGIGSEQSLSKIAVDGYSEFYQKNRFHLDNQWIEINSVAEAKKGATKYSIPIFTLGKYISDSENEKAKQCAKILQDYVNEYTGKSVAIADVTNENKTTDDLPF